VRGFDAYSEIYADSKKWLQKGWLDYLAPQLYWPITAPQQSFPALYDWWRSQNTLHRHIWPGLATYRVAENSQRHIPSSEIVAEIDTMRVRGGDLGHIHFDASALMKDPDSLDARLADLYAKPALVPASPWLGAKVPARPIVALDHDKATGDLMVRLTPRQGEKPWLWTLRWQSGDTWSSDVLPGWLRLHRLAQGDIDRVYVTAVSRTGIESAAVAAVLGSERSTTRSRGGQSAISRR
jgi:hypothetical protein